jgi:hypothetical protein
MYAASTVLPLLATIALLRGSGAAGAPQAPFVTAWGPHLAVSGSGFKHVPAAQRFATAGAPAGPRAAAPAAPRRAGRVRAHAGAGGVVASLDVGAGAAYERAVGRQAVRVAAAALRGAGRHGAAALAEAGEVVAMGVATVAWLGDGAVAPDVEAAFLRLGSVVTTEALARPRAQVCDAAARAAAAGEAAPAPPAPAPAAGGAAACGANAGPSLAALGFDGATQTVGVLDTGLYAQHCRHAAEPVRLGEWRVDEAAAPAPGAAACAPLRWLAAADAGAGAAGAGAGGAPAPAPGPAGPPRVSYLRTACAAAWCAGFATDHASLPLDHGTHVASLVLDASRARVVLQDAQDARRGGESLQLPPDLYHDGLHVLHACAGAEVVSLSFSADTRGAYTYLDRAVDFYTWNHPTATVVVAAGNAGATGSSSVGSPATAKNGVTVGAALATRGALGAICAGCAPAWRDAWQPGAQELLAPPGATGVHASGPRGAMWWSSRGPTADGRRKPDVAAVGAHVVGDYGAGAAPRSCAAGATRVALAGSSMAAPVVAAAAAQLRELLGACAGAAAGECALLRGGAGRAAGAPLSGGGATSSLLRAALIAAATPADHTVGPGWAWSPAWGALSAPARVAGAAAAALAEQGAGSGEARPGDRLLCAGCAAFFWGESAARGFAPLRGAAAAARGAAAAAWSGDGGGGAPRTRCFRAPAGAAVAVTAVLAWRDYPSQSGCTACLQSDLALSAATAEAYYGGAWADTANNAERLDVALGAGQLLKVTVDAVRVDHAAVELQPWSLAVVGDGLREVTGAECAPCALGTERAVCATAEGVGSRACGAAHAAECGNFSACFALTPALTLGETVPGLTSAQCAERHQYGRGEGCAAVAFAAGGGCATAPCARTRVLRAGGRDHACASGSVHACEAADGGELFASLRCEPAPGAAAGPAPGPAPAADRAAAERGAAASVGAALAVCAALGLAIAAVVAGASATDPPAPGAHLQGALLRAAVRGAR